MHRCRNWEPDFTTKYFLLLCLFPYPIASLCLTSEQSPNLEQSWVLWCLRLLLTTAHWESSLHPPCPVATALGQLLSCCAPLWGCGDSEWFLVQTIAAFLPICLYPFGTVLTREKLSSVPGRTKYKYNGQSWHHWAACRTERGWSTEMEKPKQCPGIATHPKRYLP